jgi:hypothetical protein
MNKHLNFLCSSSKSKIQKEITDYILDKSLNGCIC